VTIQLSILFLSVIQKRVMFIAFDAHNSDIFKYVSTIFMQFLGSFYNPNLEDTVENPKWAERVVTLTIRRRKGRDFLICIHFYCAIIGVSCTKNPGYALKNPKWAERVVVLAIRHRKIRAFQTCIHFYCAIIGVSFTELMITKAFQWIPLSKMISHFDEALRDRP